MRTVAIAPQWYKAECDPDGKIEFQLNPITNTLASDITGNVPFKRKRGKVDFDGGYLVRMLILVALVDIRGLKDHRTADSSDPENEDKMKDLVLEFEKIKIGMKKRTVLKREMLNLLPKELYAEMTEILKGDIDLDEGSEQEDDDVDFTQPSSTPTTSNVETSTVTTTIPPVAPTETPSESE